MIAVTAAFEQSFASPAELAAAVKASLGKSLRRPSGLTQLAIVGALACLPPERRSLPTALLWQTASGPRAEATVLLQEARGAGEPMPYDFLASQPAIAVATLMPWLPGLVAATHWPQPATDVASWGPLLALAIDGLAAGRYAQVLCAHLDSWDESAQGRWLLLESGAKMPLAGLRLVENDGEATLEDMPALPGRLADWIASGTQNPVTLRMPAGYRQTVEFARPAHV